MQSKVSNKLLEAAKKLAMDMPACVTQRDIDGFPDCYVRRESSMPNEMPLGEMMADSFKVNDEVFLVITKTDLM